jgi:hypothetical protein
MEKQQIDGRWLIRGPNNEAEFGTLVHDPDNGLSLTVKIPESSSPDEAFRAFMDERGVLVPDVILGRNANDKPVTLFGCYAFPSVSAGLKTYQIDVLAAVQGLQFESWSQECIRAATLDVNLLHRWLGGKITEYISVPDGKSAWTVPQEPDLVFQICMGIRLRVVRYIAPSWSEDESRWTPRPRIWLHFGAAESLRDLTQNWVPWVMRLFSLLMGISVHCRGLECYIEDPYAESSTALPTEGKVIQRLGKQQRESDDIHTHQILVPYSEIAGSFAKIIASWNLVASHFQPVVDLFSTVAFTRSLHFEAQFLFLDVDLPTKGNRHIRATD